MYMTTASKHDISKALLPAGLLLVLAALLTAAVLQRERSALQLPGGRQIPAVAAAAQAAAGGATPAPLHTCNLSLGSDPHWTARCDLLTDLCVDQGTFILHGQQYQPAPGRPAAPLPVLRTPPGVKYIVPWTGDVAQDLHMEVEAGRPYYSLIEMPRVRAARIREGAPDVARPAFSSCTLPIVWLPSWQENFYHAYLETASVLHSLLGAVPWAQHAKLVIPTPEGLAMPAYLPGLLAPLTNSSVESLADFSARGTPTARPGEQQAQQVQRDSYKGSRHRCFRQLYWCGQQQWVGTYPLTAFGQRLLQHHGYTPPPPQPPSLAAQASAVTGSSNSSSAAASNDPAAASAGARKAQAPRQQRQRRQLRVLFHHRAGASRQLLNIDELVEACNTWRFVPQGPLSAQTASAQPASAQPLAANCSRVTLGSLEATLAAAQEADVMVGMHGANLMSGFLMRPGGIVIEVWNYGFVEGAAAFLNAAQQDPDLVTSWWTLQVSDPALSQPGPYEAAKQEPVQFWARDRNARVPWDALRLVLEAAVAEAPRGGTDAYRAAAAACNHSWTVLPGRRLVRAGGAEQPC